MGQHLLYGMDATPDSSAETFAVATCDVSARDISAPALENLVKILAWRLLTRIPRDSGIEMADLIQAGNVGLAQAARTFTSDGGANLAGYAKFRIRGEMLDTVRRHIGRGLVRPRATVSHSNEELAESLPASEKECPLGQLARVQRIAILNEEIARLCPRDRTVVGLRYSRGFNLRQIGQFLRVNESRACQLHRIAIGRLRRGLAGRGVTGLWQLL